MPSLIQTLPLGLIASSHLTQIYEVGTNIATSIYVRSKTLHKHMKYGPNVVTGDYMRSTYSASGEVPPSAGCGEGGVDWLSTCCWFALAASAAAASSAAAVAASF